MLVKINRIKKDTESKADSPALLLIRKLVSTGICSMYLHWCMKKDVLYFVSSVCDLFLEFY